MNSIKQLTSSYLLIILLLKCSHCRLLTLDLRGLNLVATTTTTTSPLLTQSVDLPEFSEPIGNHTVALGRDAQFSCKINNLGNFRTAWMRVEDKGILTIHNNTITRNYRVGLVNTDDGRNFILTIKNVQATDKGGYMCQINSVPVKYAIGYLDVLTPPAFDDATALADGAPFSADATTTIAPGAGVVVVSEGSNASLSCHATGHPQPVITWRREDNEPILLNGLATESGIPKVEGTSTLQLSSVSRLNSGAYLCIAYNGVQPSASKRQLLDVQFSPVIRLPQAEVGAQLNENKAKLTCIVELNPSGSYHWVKLPQKPSNTNHRNGVADDDLSLIDHDELRNSDKFEIVIKQVANERVEMSLILRRVEKNDFGWYKCIARNSLGIQSIPIHLYESSSFSLNNMFRGSADQGLSAAAATTTQASDLSAQNDQEDGGSHRKSSLSRAHTRSSWIQRSSNGPSSSTSSRHHSEPSKALPDTSSSALSSLLAGKLVFGNLLLSNHLFLLFFCLLTGSLAQIVDTLHQIIM